MQMKVVVKALIWSIITIASFSWTVAEADTPGFITEHSGFVHVTTLGDCRRYDVSRDRQRIEVTYLNDRMLKYAWAGTPVYVVLRRAKADTEYNGEPAYVVTSLRKRNVGIQDVDVACTTNLGQSRVVGVLQSWSEGMHNGGLTLKLPTGNEMDFGFLGGSGPKIDGRSVGYCSLAPSELCSHWPKYLRLHRSIVRVLFKTTVGPNGTTMIVPLSLTTLRP